MLNKTQLERELVNWKVESQEIIQNAEQKTEPIEKSS